MTDSELAELLDRHFDWQSVPGKLFWKVKKPKVKFGEEAGWVSHGYYYLTLNRKRYKRSRVVFLLYHGHLPKMEIDHKDMNRANDHPENLRLATDEQNGANRIKQQNNKSGLKGVFWFKRDNLWTAQIAFRGKSFYLGYFKTREAAAAAYQEAAKRLHGEFARF
jgi:hypothetical protein